jgi:outer membrane protein assembly factor BamB
MSHATLALRWPICLLAIVAVQSNLAARRAGAENWPQWRGPRGNSTSLETGLPVAWNADAKIVWKTALPEWGTSTPAIWDNAVFVTTQRDEELLVLKLDRRTGDVQWTRQVGRAATARGGPTRQKQVFHRLHNLASPSPVTDGRLVVVHFGNGELAAYDFTGKLGWRRNLQEDHGAYTIWWGHANSPVLYRELVISVCMQDSLADVAAVGAPSYLLAHDLDSGRLRWKTDRMTGAPAEQADAYTTPILVETGSRTELVVMGANRLDAYDPQTGKQLWYLSGLDGGRTVTGPTASGGMIYLTRGMRGALLAVRVDAAASGQRAADDIVWRVTQGTPDTPCPVVWNELLFTITDDGIARAIDAPSGKVHWTQRLKGDYKASPLAAEGRIYYLNTSGLCTVVSASPQFEKLAENQLPDTTLASPAASGGHLFIRGQSALYCLGEKSLGDP